MHLASSNEAVYLNETDGIHSTSLSISSSSTSSPVPSTSACCSLVISTKISDYDDSEYDDCEYDDSEHDDFEHDDSEYEDSDYEFESQYRRVFGDAAYERFEDLMDDEG